MGTKVKVVRCNGAFENPFSPTLGDERPLWNSPVKKKHKSINNRQRLWCYLTLNFKKYIDMKVDLIGYMYHLSIGPYIHVQHNLPTIPLSNLAQDVPSCYMQFANDIRFA